jgi:hypothetical protein
MNRASRWKRMPDFRFLANKQPRQPVDYRAGHVPDLMTALKSRPGPSTVMASQGGTANGPA